MSLNKSFKVWLPFLSEDHDYSLERHAAVRQAYIFIGQVVIWSNYLSCSDDNLHFVNCAPLSDRWPRFCIQTSYARPRGTHARRWRAHVLKSVHSCCWASSFSSLSFLLTRYYLSVSGNASYASFSSCFHANLFPLKPSNRLSTTYSRYSSQQNTRNISMMMMSFQASLLSAARCFHKGSFTYFHRGGFSKRAMSVAISFGS